MAEVADEFEDDMDEVRDLEEIDDEVDGVDLFDDNMMRLALPNTNLLTVGIIKNVLKRIFMILRIWMMIIYMKILTPKLVDVLKRNLTEEIENLRNVVVSNDLPPFLIPVVLRIGIV
jgi:hypothetical protein